MKIILEIKDTATLSRIEELSHAIFDYSDIIASIDREW